MSNQIRAACFILSIMLLSFSSSAFFNQSPSAPSSAILAQLSFVLTVMVPLMLLMVIIAGIVYMVGQMFGSETRARATVWAHGMLIAVGMSAVIVALLFAFLPGLLSGTVPSIDLYNQYGTGLLNQLSTLVGNFLILLTITLIVIAAGVYAIGQTTGSETRARANNWASGLLGGAIISAVLYVLLFQILGQLNSFFVNSQYLGLYGGVIIQICFFVAVFILITYLVSRFFKVPEWEAYLNVEMSNLMSSFLIVLFVVALFAFGSLVIIILPINPVGTLSPPQAAISYMQSTVADSSLRASIDVYKIQACTSILSTFSRRIGEFVLTQTYKVFPGIDTFVSITNVLGMSLLTLYNTVSVQIVMLYLVDALMVPLVLPAGLILRFFPPTRDAGAFLISVAFGFYVVFPITYLINAKIFQDIGGQPYNSPTILIQSLCGPFKYGAAGFLFNPSANPLFGLLPGTSGTAIGNLLSKFVSESLLNMVSMAEFIPIMRHIAALSLLALFMPALSMMVTIAFINAMTKFIVAKV